ncbi:MAG TPA: glycosyltransferase, partial [Candidatus Thermoplasmatota archaeon]|nr:glycosyltransferase [Candidatus Thermoplasmatota archaeon]
MTPLRLLAAAALGAVSALTAALLALATRQTGWDAGATEALLAMRGLATPTPAQGAVLLAAALAGAVLALAAVGAARARQAVRLALGAAFGALAGVASYVTGALFASWRDVASREALTSLAMAAARSFTVAEAVCAATGAVVGVLLARYAWRVYGVVSYVAIVSIVVGYVGHEAFIVLPHVPRSALPFSLLLFAVEAATLGMAAVHAFYSLDVASRKRWLRTPHDAPFSRYYQPKVAFHVAAYNEPPDLVVETLDRVLAVDYPKDRVVVMLLDDSTDPEVAAVLEDACQERGVTYLRRSDRRGFKAGALNDALRRTPPDVDLIAVLDADYQVEPEYLRETVGHFIDPKLGFLQTPQDYRNVEQSFLTRQYAYADAYFYRAVLPSRNEENAIIFCGTMGIVRRQALEEAGGWGEDYLCEDAELSVRILDRGYTSLYVARTYGRGLIPATFESYRRQHHRWAYGGGQLLRGHARRLLLGPMSARQKLDYLFGGLHWLDGVAVFLMAGVLLALAAADLAGSPLVTHHAGEVALLALVPFFLLVDGVLRLHLALRRSLRLPLSATLGVLGMWMSAKLSNARGALKGLLGLPMAFARTPKDGDRRLGWGRAALAAVRAGRLESAMAALLLGASAALAWGLHAAWAGAGDVSVARALL